MAACSSHRSVHWKACVTGGEGAACLVSLCLWTGLQVPWLCCREVKTGIAQRSLLGGGLLLL